MASGKLHTVSRLLVYGIRALNVMLILGLVGCTESGDSPKVNEVMPSKPASPPPERENSFVYGDEIEEQLIRRLDEISTSRIDKGGEIIEQTEFILSKEFTLAEILKVLQLQVDNCSVRFKQVHYSFGDGGPTQRDAGWWFIKCNPKVVISLGQKRTGGILSATVAVLRQVDRVDEINFGRHFEPRDGEPTGAEEYLNFEPSLREFYNDVD